MFARFYNVRLAAAEKALRQGRVDEAYDAVRQPDVGQTPRGRKLLDDLVRPLLARARLHRQAGRYVEALADLDRLVAIDRGGDEARALRQQVLAEAREQARQEGEQRQALGQAAAQLEAGRLETVRLNLERVADAGRREALAGEVDVRLRRCGQLLEQAQTAVERGDVLAAIGFWQDACRRHGRSRETDEFAVRLGEAGARATESWVAEGRLDRVHAASAGLAALAAISPALGATQRVAGLCERAGRLLAAADYPALRQTLLQLKAGGGRGAWLDQALEALGRIVTDHEALLAGPLGTVLPGSADHGAPALEESDEAGHARVSRADDVADPAAVRLDQPLLVLVDGGGAGLLVGRDVVRLGREGGPEVDVPLPGDVHSHHADVARRGEDYFVTAYGPVEVNQRRIEHTLLRDGDRITLGPRVALVFSRPSAKSESAVLRLSHRCRLPQDVGEVILFRRTCLIGRGSGCHLPRREGDEQVVLFERGGALHVRQTAGSRWESAAAQPVVAGRVLEFGDLRVTVKPYDGAERRTSG